MPFLRRRTASGVTDTLPGSAMNDREPAEPRDAMFRRGIIDAHAARLEDLDSPGLTPIMNRVEENLRLVPAGLRDGNPTRGYDEVAAGKQLEGSEQGPA
jgi:hypothetical protein